MQDDFDMAEDVSFDAVHETLAQSFHPRVSEMDSLSSLNLSTSIVANRGWSKNQ